MSSNYPNGFASGVVIRGIPLTQTHPGEVFWVNNSSVLAKGGIGGSDGNKGSYREPFATVDKGIGACTASRGDIVFIMPGHNEGSATANAEIFDLNVAGVAVIGLGRGTLKPTFDLDVASASIACDSANNIISNIRVRASVTAVVAGIDLTATCNNLILDKIDFIEEAGLGGVDEFLDCVQTFTTDAGNDGLVVNDCTYLSSSTECLAFVQLRSAMHEVTVSNNRVTFGINNSESFVGVNTAADIITGINIIGNSMTRLNTSGPLIFEGTSNSCTGLIADNYVRHLDVAAALIIPVGSPVLLVGNLLAEAIDVSGFVIPAIGNDA